MSKSHVKGVSMGLDVSRKTAKNLAVKRKMKEFSPLAVKNVNRKKVQAHRSRDLFLSLMCYAFMCSGSENYNRNRKCRKNLHDLSHGCRCAS